jgi:hypothetical protein
MLAAYGGAVAKGGVPNVSWYPRPSFGHVATYFSELAGRVPIRWGARLGLLLFFFPICLLLIKGVRRRLPVWVLQELVIGLLLISFLPVTITFVISQLASQSIWGARHLISSAMPFLLLVSLGVMAIESVRWRRTGVAVLAVWALVAGFCGIIQENRKLAWDRLVREIAESRPNVVLNVYCLENFTYLPLAFYVSEEGHKNLAVKEVATVPSGAGTFWLVVRETGIDEVRAVLESARYNVGTPITIEKQYTKVLAYPVSVEAAGLVQPGYTIRSATAASLAK